MKTFNIFINESYLLLTIALALINLSNNEKNIVLNAIKEHPERFKKFNWKKNLTFDDFKDVIK